MLDVCNINIIQITTMVPSSQTRLRCSIVTAADPLCNTPVYSYMYMFFGGVAQNLHKEDQLRVYNTCKLTSVCTCIYSVCTVHTSSHYTAVVQSDRSTFSSVA